MESNYKQQLKQAESLEIFRDEIKKLSLKQ